MAKPIEKKRSAVERVKRWWTKRIQDSVVYNQRSMTVSAANTLVDRNQLRELFVWRDFDQKENLIFLDDNFGPSLGFAIEYSPLMQGGTDAETQLEGIINRAPDNAVMQFCMWSSPCIDEHLDAWAYARLEYCKDPLLVQNTKRCSEYFKNSVTDYSILPLRRFQPRYLRYFLFFRIPFDGDIESTEELNHWIESSLDVRQSVLGIFSAVGVSATVMGERSLKRVLKQLVNPQNSAIQNKNLGVFSEVEEDESTIKEPIACTVMESTTRLRVENDGTLAFSNGDEKPKCVIPITVDSYPDHLYLHMTGQLVGDLIDRDCIAPQFFLYTTVVKENNEKATAICKSKMGILNKQTMSASPWYMAMMEHLYTRQDDTRNLINITRSDHTMVRMYTGINILTEPENIKRDIDLVVATWRKRGFKASVETNISLPIWLASLPFQYAAHLDKPTGGLMRATMVSSVNAASAVHITGDWAGTTPYRRDENKLYGGGPMMFSTRGQISCIDLFNTDTNYSFVITAVPGAGKSFLANGIIEDIKAKDGVIRAIDVGGSYKNIAETLGGQLMRFDPMNPRSMNPFWGLKDSREIDPNKIDVLEINSEALVQNDDEDQGEILEMMPLLHGVVLQMCYPNKSEDEVDAFEHRYIDSAIWEVWKEKQEKMETKDLYDYFLLQGTERGDRRILDLAEQLKPYAVGRYREWFNGKREFDFKNPFLVIEMDELNSDKILRGIVLTLTISSITREFYLTDRSRRKLLLIDEAYDLLGDEKSGSGEFIEVAYRRIRKYFGSAGVIVHGFMDYHKSSAAMAAYSNAAWKFTLKQSGPSIEFARKNGMLPESDYFHRLMGTLNPGKGYSEIFIQQDQRMGLFYYIVDPHTLMTYSTNPADITTIDRLRAKGHDVATAIDIAAREIYAARGIPIGNPEVDDEGREWYVTEEGCRRMLQSIEEYSKVVDKRNEQGALFLRHARGQAAINQTEEAEDALDS